MANGEFNIEAEYLKLETELVLFKPSEIHGLGGFAKTNLRAGVRVLEYEGEKINKAESVRRCEQNNVYIFALNDELDLDGDFPWNPARYLNHSCCPNCEAQYEVDHIWIIAKRDIKPGEELTFNYGFDLENYREYPCLCGSETASALSSPRSSLSMLDHRRIKSLPELK